LPAPRKGVISKAAVLSGELVVEVNVELGLADPYAD